MGVLYIVVVLAGCLLPFLAENTKKDRIVTGIFMLGDLILTTIMVYSEIAYLRYLGKPENVFIAGCLFLLSISIKKIQGMTTSKDQVKAPKTRHQNELNQNHKAAS